MVNLLNIDCMKWMADRPDNYYDIAIVDPEYGRGEDGGVNRSGWVTQENGTKKFVKKGNHYKKKQWDNEPASPEYFQELFRVSKRQIIWGVNYYKENFGPGRIIWDKVNQGSDQSDCEIAYNSTNHRVDMIPYMWRGMMQGKSISEGRVMQGNKKLNEKRIHPTQKPVIIYKWILSKYCQKDWNILDTHGGSMSHAIACHDLGFKLDICEMDEEYFMLAKERFNQHTSQLILPWPS